MSADKRDLILDGKTASGIHIRIEKNPIRGPYRQPYLAKMSDGRRLWMSKPPKVYRDGGTLELTFVDGNNDEFKFVIPSRLRGGEPTMNGEAIK